MIPFTRLSLSTLIRHAFRWPRTLDIRRAGNTLNRRPYELRRKLWARILERRK